MGDFYLHSHQTLNSQVQFGSWTVWRMDICGNPCWWGFVFFFFFFIYLKLGILCSFLPKKAKVKRWIGLNALADAAVQPLP